MISLEKHVQQLRNVIAKHTGSSMPQVQTIIFVMDSEQIASRCGRSFKLTSSTLIGLRDAMSCSGFLISDGTTWVSPPRYCDPHKNKTMDLLNMNPDWLETSGRCWQVDRVRIVCSLAPD